MSEPEYEIPAELDEIMEEGLAAEEAMKACVKGFFKFQLRNAIYIGKTSRAKKHEFWQGVYALYPELKGQKLSYEATLKELTVL